MKYTEQDLKDLAAQLFKNSDEALKYADDNGTFISEAKYNAKKAAAEKEDASDLVKAEFAGFKFKFENPNVKPAAPAAVEGKLILDGEPIGQKELDELLKGIETSVKQLQRQLDDAGALIIAKDKVIEEQKAAIASQAEQISHLNNEAIELNKKLTEASKKAKTKE